MAYQKKYKTYKRNGTKKWYNRKYSAKDLAIKALKNTKYLRGLVNSEMFHNQGTATVSVSNTGTILTVSQIAQGDTSSGRTGISILARNLLLRFAIEQHASATSTFYRMIVFQDTQQVADTLPAVTDVLETASTLAPLATANLGRFKVLKNWFFSTDNVKGKTRIIEKYFDLYTHIRYNSSSSTDIQKNGIYILLLSDQATNTLSITYNFKLGYRDN